MQISDELITFFKFVSVGIIISVIFDFFRACRKIKKTSSIEVLIQDIIFFFIATVITTISIIIMLDSNIRVYVFFAIIFGCLIYLSLFSKIIIKLQIMFLKQIASIISVFCTPIILDLQIFTIICKFFKKNIQKCCKKFFFVLSLICKFIKKNGKFFSKIKRKQKRD
jgi:spore cortex biosynthesis protein YabQ